MPSQLTYLFDPLCGWCYGASPVIQQLAQQPGIQLQLAPTGLFSGTGGRVMDAHFADYAWSNDLRIQKLTGQRFTEVYRSQVLGRPGFRFDSGATTLALTAVALTEAQREIAALKLLQEARYLDGQDTSDRATVIQILRHHGLASAADLMQADDAALTAAYNTRVQQTRQQMRDHGAQGVPALVFNQSGTQRLLPGDLLFGHIDNLLAAITA